MNVSWRRASRVIAGPLLAAVLLLGSSTAAAGETRPALSPAGDDIVLKVNLRAGYTIGHVERTFHVRVVKALLPSRGIYQVRADVRAKCFRCRLSSLTTTRLTRTLDADQSVVYAEPSVGDIVELTRFHSWPEGSPEPGFEAADLLDQPLARDLGRVGRLSRGAGVIVAVLDTGVDPNHPALREKLLPSGYDYVGDDRAPWEVRALRASAGRSTDETGSFGHGTFVAGVVGLVAPGVKILPMRVLDSSGVGQASVVAEAVDDAVRDGATVINMSFGSEQSASSEVLDEALIRAREAGVVVVGAAGNLGTDQPLYPANGPGVLSVACLDPQTRRLAAYSSFGPWADVAADGDDLIGPLPGGAYAKWSGTSMAAPVVAAQAALIRSRVPSLGRAEVLRAITATSRPVRGRSVRFGGVRIYDSLLVATALGRNH